MPRRKKVEGIEYIGAEEKPSNDAWIAVSILINGNEESYEIQVKDFCANVVRIHQTPETILRALVEGLEAKFGKRLSYH